MYNSRSEMSHLDRDRWRAVSERLDEALDLSENERPQWMAALHEQNPSLAEDLRVLLEEHEIVRRQRFLEESLPFRPALSVENEKAAAPGPVPFESHTFGAYKLVSPLGHGGMGVVWLGERCDGQFEARAAVKLLDIGRFGRSGARFRREATILARVSHPNIAHVIDAGVSTDGQPYLVLELVDGQPIDRYCDERSLDVPSRIRLFLDVLGAVAHAHTQRIVHRDIKPSNVLVRTDGHVKLLDFGIAKLLERDGLANMASTLTLDQGAALTPAYAAPEQVGGGEVTTATDVYALGVLLYVLVTGQHPCGEVSSPADLMKAIVDVDPLPASAAVVDPKMPATERTALAANRATTPDLLHRLLKGNLDTIIGKALKKAPHERFASVADLADDLRRYLASEPIRARRDSLARRTVRFARQRPALTVAGTISALVIGGVAGFYAIRPAVDRDQGSVAAPQAPVPVTSETGDETWPSLSPDRTRLAFAWATDNASTTRIAIKTLAADTTVVLTDGSAHDTQPVWSPDGQHIAFIRSFRDPEHRRQICLIPVAGGALRVLHTSGFNLPGLAWWRAGNALLFSTRSGSIGPFHLAALDLATLQVKLLTQPPPAPRLGAPGDSLPAIAPDDRTAAFIRETHEGRDVFLLDLVTGRESRLTRDHHRLSGLTWAADG